jgi:hypothetical protein
MTNSSFPKREKFPIFEKPGFKEDWAGGNDELN